MPSETELIARHYASRLQTWIDEYENPTGYPFTRIRLDRITKHLKDNGIRRDSVLDIGCGVGIPAMEIAEPEASIFGFDLSTELVEYASARAQRMGLHAQFTVGSATTAESYPDGLFDVILALGVFQHINEEIAVLTHIKQHLALDGLAVLSFRNPLFGLITFNRPSYELFRELFSEFRDSQDGPILDDFLTSKLDLSQPPVRSGGSADPQLDDVVYKYHNPLTMKDLLEQVDLTPVHVDFYRYHATPPALEPRSPQQFREISLQMDSQPNDWRSMFLCSTYLVYCRHS